MPATDHQRVLLHAFSTFQAGGPQLRFVDLANAFGSEFKHLLVAMDGRFDAAERLAPGVNFKILSLAAARGGALANRGRCRALLDLHRPDMLLSYNWGAVEWIAANLPQRMPQVHIEDGFRPDEAMGQLRRRMWARRLLFLASGVRLLVPSQRLRDVAATWWVPSARLRLVPNGVEVPAERDAAPAPQPGERPVVIGTVAALRAEKNIPRLLRAVAALRNEFDLRLLIVGDGEERPRLESLAHELGLNDITEFAGYCAAPAQMLQRMDLFALTSDTEQLPIAMLEAMAQALPVVATRVGDVPRVMPPEAVQALCEPDDQAFAQTLAAVLHDRARWQGWASAGQALVRRRYGRDRMLAEWLTVFRGQWPEAQQS